MGYEHFIEIAFGAVLGGGLTYLHTYMQMREERKEEHRARLSALLAEMEDNRRALDSGVIQGYAKIRLSQSMWDESRGEIFRLPQDLGETLRSLYHKVWQLNCAIEYDLAHSAIGRGVFDASINAIADDLKKAIGPAVEKHRAYLTAARRS